MKVYIITSAKFEECYIEEWVQYHLNIGFDKIIINDNNPKDYPYNPKDILKKYIDNNQVIVERYYNDNNIIPEENQDGDMHHIYTWLYNKYKDEFDWVAKLDIDEFLEIPETNNDIKKFLQQDKFNNVLSIVIPWIEYGVKYEYCDYYTRLKNNRDRYIINQGFKFFDYTFKIICRKTDYMMGITNHTCKFYNIYNNDYILYVYPDGFNVQNIKYEEWGESDRNKYITFIENNQKYLFNLTNICHINHYCIRSTEERANHLIKFKLYKISDYWKQLYDDIYKQNPELLDNPRDLYKLYFIDDINGINNMYNKI